MGQRHKHADVVIAWAEGKDVQIWDKGAKCWCDVGASSPSFNEDWEYRVKPPAKKYRVALFNDHTCTYTAYTADNTEDASSYEKERSFVRWLTDWVEYEE